ncbi:hypothetical protein [Pedobacter sp. WC2423]|uniref:hypothetical protein n=1 Tax=Pedobacter sp. WC2423 TaxID=3234142 RepID=UPI003465F46E
MVDKLADHPNQIHLSPYAYGWNNPTNLTDPDGNCPQCFVFATEALTYVAATALAAVSTYMIVSSAKQISNNGSFYSSAQDNTSVSQPKLQAIAKSENVEPSSDKKDVNKPSEPYNRKKHYGNTPKKSDRKALDTKPGEVVDHEPELVKRYYEGDSSTGEKPGYQMTPEVRKSSANDRTRMKNQGRAESNSQGGRAKKYSMDQKKKHEL